MQYFIEGFLLQASLILAMGAQNLYVLHMGLRREHHLLIALVCTACDLFLVLLGVLGMSALFSAVPFLKIFIGALGVAFLFHYGILKLKEACQPAIPIQNLSAPAQSRRKIFFFTIGFSLLNPHVILDTLVLIGGYSAKFPLVSERIQFGLGAAALSGFWFFGLALMASALSPFFKNPRAMQVVSLISAIILITLAVILGSDVWQWIS